MADTYLAIGSASIDSVLSGGGTVSSGSAISMTDNVATAFEFKEATNSYLLFKTTDGTERIVAGKIIAFEGSTASFPALKRSGTKLQIRLADDSDLGAGESKTFDLTAASGEAYLQFTATTGNANIYFPDNRAAALVFKNASDLTSYLTFVSTNSGDKVKVDQTLDVNATLTMSGGQLQFTRSTGLNIINATNGDLGIYVSSTAYMAFNSTSGYITTSKPMALGDALALKTSSAAGSTTVAATSTYHGVTGTSGGTITLAAVSGYADGTVLTIKDEGGNAATNNITVDPNASETIDGVTTKVINTNYGVLRIIKRNSAWFTI